MKKICKILSFVLICCCSFFALAGCGSNPLAGNPEAVSTAVNNFNGFKAIYIPKMEREFVLEEATKAFEILDATSLNVLGQIETEIELEETEFAMNNQTKLTAFMINQVLSLADNEKLDTSNNSLSQEIMINAMKKFTYYGLKSEDITETVKFICSLSEQLAGSEQTISMILNSSVSIVVGAELGSGLTYFYNLYIQNYSAEFVEKALKDETEENPFYLPEENYVALVYMTKNQFEIDKGDFVNEATTYYGFWGIESTDPSVKEQIKASFEFLAKDAQQAQSCELTLENEESLGDYFMLSETPINVKPNVQFSTENDETAGGEVTSSNAGEVKRVFNGTEFDQNGIIACMKQTENGWKYQSSTHDVMQLLINNESGKPFKLSGIGSLIFEKI